MSVSPFFQDLSIILHIDVTSDYQHSEYNLVRLAHPDAKLLRVRPEVHRFTEDLELVNLTDAEWNQVAFSGPEITLIGETDRTFQAPNGQHFTVRELVDVIRQFEEEDRPLSCWFGGIDLHHRYFEGLRPTEGGWTILYGS